MATAAIIGAATVGSAAIAADAAGDAADAQAKAAQQGIDAQLEMYYQNRQDLLPWLYSGEQGLYALYELSGLPYYKRDPETGELVYTEPSQDQLAYLQNLPGYQFAYDQGLQALDRTAASRGNLISGNQLQAATQYGQNMAALQYGNEWNRLASLAGYGQTAGQYLGDLGTNTANSLASLYAAQGNAAAAGTLGTASAYSQGLNTLAMLYGSGAFSTNSTPSYINTSAGYPVITDLDAFYAANPAG